MLKNPAGTLAYIHAHAQQQVSICVWVRVKGSGVSCSYSTIRDRMYVYLCQPSQVNKPSIEARVRYSISKVNIVKYTYRGDDSLAFYALIRCVYCMC